MNPTCNDPNTSSGEPCKNRVSSEDVRCYRHKDYVATPIPEDLSQVVGKKPTLIVIDDVFGEDGKEIPKEVLESVISPSKNTPIHLGTFIITDKKPILKEVEDDTIGKDYSLLWNRLKRLFKRNKK